MLNEGIVPQRKAGGSLLNDGDREVFKSLHMELAPTAREEGCIQKFYLYLMLSKPSRQLVITYAAMNGQGKSCHPSSLIGRSADCSRKWCQGKSGKRNGRYGQRKMV